MVRIISNVCFIWVVVHWWSIITTTTAWTNHQRAPPHPKWTSQVYHDVSSTGTPTVRQQQQQLKGLGSSKVNDTTLIEPTATATATASDTSIKVRALASFISMTMLEPMLAAGVPIEKIMSMTSSSSVSDDAVESRTTTTPLHQKEGDRIVSIEDTFDTGDTAPTIPLQPPTVIVDGHDDDTAHNSDAPITSSGTSLSPTTVEPRPSPSSSSLLLIPPIPSVISTAFGRPLSVVQQHEPPLQQPQILTTATTMEEKEPPLQPPQIMTTTTMKENVPSLQQPQIMTTTTMVSDEDPYGE